MGGSHGPRIGAPKDASAKSACPIKPSCGVAGSGLWPQIHDVESNGFRNSQPCQHLKH